MKKNVVFCALALCLFAVSCVCHKTDWNSIMEEYRQDETVSSLILVKYRKGSDCRVEYYLRDSLGDWMLDGEAAGYVGKNGLDKKKEGDMKTPVGEFNICKAFGILPDPGTALEYIPVTESTFACEDDCPYYNQIVDTTGTGHKCTGEDMSKIIPAYNYGMTMDFNKENVYGKGCNIFFHCFGTHDYTAGCVAVDEVFMVHVLRTCGTSPVISIH